FTVVSIDDVVFGLVRLLIEFFFFSGRRRHTRFSRDWSSDVCLPIFGSAPSAARSRAARRAVSACGSRRGSRGGSVASRLRVLGRSEERRVGKECRSWWSREPSQQRARARGSAAAVSVEREVCEQYLW